MMCAEGGVERECRSAKPRMHEQAAGMFSLALLKQPGVELQPEVSVVLLSRPAHQRLAQGACTIQKLWSSWLEPSLCPAAIADDSRALSLSLLS